MHYYILCKVAIFSPLFSIIFQEDLLPKIAKWWLHVSDSFFGSPSSRFMPITITRFVFYETLNSSEMKCTHQILENRDQILMRKNIESVIKCYQIWIKSATRHENGQFLKIILENADHWQKRIVFSSPFPWEHSHESWTPSFASASTTGYTNQQPFKV